MSGLNSMENGVLGEARARAFLLERFWVLERSVDIHGADYLIQRRITDRNFMDRSPPKLGVVQVKYVQDGSTYLSIFKDYLCDADGHAYKEFFLLVFTGRESSSRSFLLSSDDFLKMATEKFKSGRAKFQLKASVVLDSSNHEILDYTRALDRIDHALKNADFLANRRFLGATSYVKISPDQIEHDLLLPLDNHYSDIGKAFFDEKKKLQRIVFDAEEILEAMQKMLRSTDPEEAFRIYEEDLSQHIGSGHGIVIDADFFNDEDFLSAVKNHRQRLDAIRDRGVEGNFFALLQKIGSEIPWRISDFEIAEGTRVRVTVTYDADTLSNARVTVKGDVGTDDAPRLVRSRPGRHEIVFAPYQCFSWEVRAGKTRAPDSPEEIEKAIRERIWQIRRPLQSEIERHLIGEELAISW
ncbi:hypothetical protein [Halomonas sp. E14]|uniref:hypothetical protein n=1 Tax=Halomonas sp. E14 TaxID=3397245 RepID=UPI00403E8BE1